MTFQLQEVAMPSVTVDEWSFDRLDFIRRATGLSHAAIVRSVLERLSDEPSAPRPPGSGQASVAPGASDAPTANGTLKVFADYKGQRIEGVFDLTGKTLRVTTNPLPGQTFDSPTAAAVAVVKALSPER